MHQKLKSIVDARNFYVALYDQETGTYSFPYYVDEYDRWEEIAPEKLKKSLLDYVRRSGQPLLVNKKTHRELVQRGEIELVGTQASDLAGRALENSQRGVRGLWPCRIMTAKPPIAQEEVDIVQFHGRLHRHGH